MKIIEVPNFWFCNLTGYSITLFPFIFYCGFPTTDIRVHEYTHVSQIREKGWIKFYVSYLWYYSKNLLKYRDSYTAYMQIPYEIEAYSTQDRALEMMKYNPGFKVTDIAIRKK
jgi:hypothetical protein